MQSPRSAGGVVLETVEITLTRDLLLRGMGNAVLICPMLFAFPLPAHLAGRGVLADREQETSREFTDCS